MLFRCGRDGRSCLTALRLDDTRYIFMHPEVSQTRRVLHSAFNAAHCKEAARQKPERAQCGAKCRLTQSLLGEASVT
jgi:hypothetical protein